MLVASGTVLVLLTWAVLACVLAMLGTPLAAFIDRDAPARITIRAGLWWGLLVFVLLALAINLVAPLRSGTALAAVIVVTAVGAFLSVVCLRGRWRLPRTRSARWLLVLLIPVLVLALAALGPVTNYDSGLYHLGAIRYASDFSTIPGLANVYFAFGYANAQFPFASLLGAGPWQFEGFRLANGLVIVLAVIDLVLRSRGRRTAGFWVLLVGLTAVLVTMVPLADYWVTSPSQDSTVFALTVVATAYLADVVAARAWVRSASPLIAVTLLLVLHRPTMVVYAGCVLVVVLVVGVRRRGRVGRLALVAAVAAFAAGALATARDALLSGWVQYPLSVLPLDVAWRALDPTAQRLATLGNARDPATYEQAATSWSWIGAWAGRLPQQWETWAFAALAVAALGGLLVARTRTTLRTRALLAVAAPSAVAAAAWLLVTPPAFRFAWGPLLTLGTIPLGWAAWRLEIGGSRMAPRLLAGLCLAAIATTSLWTAVARTDVASMTAERHWSLGVAIPYAVTPLTEPAIAEGPNTSGLTVRTPITGEQCWAVFPVCTPQTTGTLRLRGTTIQDGFLP